MQKTTKHFRPWMVVYVEFHSSKSEAMQREKQLKSERGRNFLWEYIKDNY